MKYEKICQANIGSMRLPNTSFAEELKAGNFSPVGRWKRQLSAEKVKNIEQLVGGLLAELGYPISSATVSPDETSRLGLRLRAMRALYPPFYRLKEWLKTQTPFGRFVNMYRLRMDECEIDGGEPDGREEENEQGAGLNADAAGIVGAAAQPGSC
jgi:hypothetical protein